MLAYIEHKEGGFVVPRQFMFVLRMECLKVTLCYEGKSCWWCGQNIRRWLFGTKENHVCTLDGMLEYGLVDQDKYCLCCELNVRRRFSATKQVMFVPHMNIRRWICWTKINHFGATDKMLEGGFVEPMQIMFSADGMLEYALVIQRRMMLLSQTKI